MKMENGTVFRPIPPSVRPDTFSNPQPASTPNQHGICTKQENPLSYVPSYNNTNF